MTGTVRLGGKPLRCGTVVIFAGDGSHHGAAIDGGGRYAAVGVPEGEAKVAVYAPDPTPPELRLVKPADAVAFRRAAGWMPIAARYSDPGRSGLAFTATPPSCRFDLDLDP